MNRRMGKKKLTRLILAALMSAGGVLCWSPSVEAVNQVTLQTRFTTTEFNLSGTETNTEGNAMNTYDYVFGNIIAAYNPGSVQTTAVISPSSTYQSTGTSVSSYILNNWTSAASGFTTTMTGGTLGYLYGGYTVGPDVAASNNTVTISGGTVSDRVAGGYSLKGNASGNTVTIESGATVGEIYGGNANGGGTGSADNNTVTINGGTVNGEINGGFSVQGNATGNQIIINNTDSAITSYIVGGYANYSGTGNSENNTVTVNDGTVSGAGIIGGYSGSGAATGNIVNIAGGTVTTYIYGGNGSTGASGNTVTISGSADLGEGTARIYGGMAQSGADNNIVNILIPVNVMHILGGENMDGTATSGNTLNIAATGVVVGDEGVAGFQNMNFYLPSTVKSGDTMLAINAKSGLTGEGMATDLTGVTFGVAALSGVSLAKNDTVNLITNPNGLTTDETLKTADSASLGTAEFLTANNLATDTKYTLGISKSGDNTIIATVENVTEESGGGSGGGTAITAEDRLKSPVETRAAAVTLLNAGADMLASQGFAQAANAVALEAAEQAKNAEPGAATPAASTFTPFAAFGGSSMRAESGSHVDTKGFGINVGFAKEFPNSQGKLLFGPVVEYGGGKYDSYNNDIHGDGNSHYWGVGVMARQVNHDGFYYEGSVRGGRVTSDYGANYPAGRVSYDSSSNYWAAHLGLGKVFAAGAKGTVDGYLKYFYSHQSGDDVTLNGVGERASFDSVDSNRIRIGARYTHKINEMNSLYGGLAYQYEFGGEARAHYSLSGEAPSPSVKGSSGLLELGWQVKPGGPVTIDLGVTGWAGKQRGGSVQLGATWTF